MTAIVSDAAATVADAGPDGAASGPPSGEPARIRVWDAPTRTFHWLLAASFTGAWLLAEADDYRSVHAGFGYAVAALVAIRIVWGIVGTRHARFAQFVTGPRAAREYLRGLLRGRPRHYAGHNPLGALAIAAMLVLALGTAATGWMTLHEVGGEGAEDVHELLASAWLVLVGLHVIGVLVGSLVHHENLVRAMISGWKSGLASEGIRRTYAPLGVLVLAVAAGAFAWGTGLWSGTATPAGLLAGTVAADSTLARAGGESDDDEDD